MSYFAAALSCEQRPFFLVTRLFSKILLSLVIVKSDRLNKSGYCTTLMADLATERERQLKTARANQTTGLANGRAEN